MQRGPSNLTVGRKVNEARVALLDDHALIRQAISRVLEGFSIQEIYEADNGSDFLRICREHQPDLVIVDLMLPDRSSIETIKQISATLPEIKILVVSAAPHQSSFDEAIAAGADGYLHKTSEVHLLRIAIETLLSGSRFLGNVPGPKEATAHLTPRETDVLRLVAQGCSTKEVASRLEISVGTADHYRTNLMRKLRLHDAVALTRYALKMGIASLD